MANRLPLSGFVRASILRQAFMAHARTVLPGMARTGTIRIDAGRTLPARTIAGAVAWIDPAFPYGPISDDAGIPPAALTSLEGNTLPAAFIRHLVRAADFAARLLRLPRQRRQCAAAGAAPAEMSFPSDTVIDEFRSAPRLRDDCVRSVVATTSPAGPDDAPDAQGHVIRLPGVLIHAPGIAIPGVAFTPRSRARNVVAIPKRPRRQENLP